MLENIFKKMSSRKVHVHFGAGSIGRGLIAPLSIQSGYHFVFVDSSDTLIDELNKQKEYSVTYMSKDGDSKHVVKGFEALSTKRDSGAIVERISTADIVTCSTCPENLETTAELVAEGICKRRLFSPSKKLNYPLVVMACENMICGTDVWRKHIENYIGNVMNLPEVISDMKYRARFANAEIDRIVPEQQEGSGLNLRMEAFFDWCVESKPFEGARRPDIKGIHFVDNLKAFVERKLCTVNTGHTAAAYAAKNRGIKLIHEAMNDPDIARLVTNALKETTELLIDKWDMDPATHDAYVQKVINRFSNPALSDPVERVARDPLRKLGRYDRFIDPAAQLTERGMPCEALLSIIEDALRFQNVAGDAESEELSNILSENNAEDATRLITNLERDHPLFDQVKERVEKVQQEMHEQS